MFSHRPELFTNFLNYEYANLAYQISSRSAVAANFSYVDFDSTTFDSIHRYAYAIGISYAADLMGNFSTGITVKLVYDRIGKRSAHAFAADLVYFIESKMF